MSLRRPTPHFMVAMGVLAMLMIVVFFVLGTTWAANAAPDSTPRAQRPSLPERCAVYYNDGTDRWKDCMGVGLK